MCAVAQWHGKLENSKYIILNNSKYEHYIVQCPALTLFLNSYKLT